MAVKTVALNRVGSIDLLDLKVISESQGRDGLPFPLARTRPGQFTEHDAYAAYTRTVPDRFAHGDLGVFRKWFSAFVNADIRVECRVQHFGDAARVARILAHRSGQAGFLAVQQSNHDVVDVFTVSPYDLGGAIAGTVELTKPGIHSQIVIPEYIPQSLRDEPRPVGGRRTKGSSPVEVSSRKVAVYATVQSHWQSARNWGLDPAKDTAVWVRITDDGDYLYTPDYRYATPLTRPGLSERVDRLIAGDIARIRAARADASTS